MTHAEKEVRNLEIVKMRHDGKSMSEIAETYGLTNSAVHCICKRYGVAGVMSDRKSTVDNPKNQYTSGQFDREANAIRYIAERTPNFEYVGNFTGLDGYVDLKCKVCGTVVHKSFVSVKHGKATCAVCAKRETQERHEAKRIQHEKQKQSEREERERNKWMNMSFVQTSMVACPCCGGYFVPVRGMKYCSIECANRINNAIQKDKRIKRMRHVVVDRNITLERLYERDNGKCYICGCICDWNDYIIRDDGTFIANDNYPSIDHVKPLSKGGKHAWGNVKLACRGCNSKKRDKTCLPML